VIVWAPDRERALARSLRALNEFDVGGIPTTIGAAAQVIRSEGFARGDYSTSYLDDAAVARPDFAEAEA
jgi:biotin carboxylase